MFVGYMPFALLDAYQKMSSSNSNEEISNIALEIKLTRIRSAYCTTQVKQMSCTCAGNEAFTYPDYNLKPLHIITMATYVSKIQMRCILNVESDSIQIADVYHLFNMVLIPKAPGRLLQCRRSVQE